MATRGNPDAQARLAYQFYHGNQRPPDKAQACQWANRYAGHNQSKYPQILTIAGLCQYYGAVGTVDYIQAAQLYTRAALAGDAIGQYHLGEVLLLGRGVEQDFHTSYLWFAEAAKQELPKAQFMLGKLLLDGKGVDADKRAAFCHFESAALQADKTAQGYLGLLLIQEPFVALGEAQFRAALWLQEAAEEGNAAALRQLVSSLEEEQQHVFQALVADKHVLSYLQANPYCNAQQQLTGELDQHER